MWIESTTNTLLILGIIPLLHIAFKIFSDGWKKQFTVTNAFIVLTWIAYHLDPFLAKINGELWQDFLLVPSYINDGLFFSALSMYFVLIGRRIAVNKSKNFYSISSLRLPRIREYWIWVLSAVIIILSSTIVGGFGELLSSSTIRGAGQFETRNSIEELLHILNIIVRILSIVLAVLSSFLILKGSNSIITGSLGIVTSSLPFMFGFSRVSGLSFLILAFILFIYKQNKIHIAVFIFIFSFLLSMVGLHARGNYNPGILNYFYATIDMNSYEWILSENSEVKNNSRSEWFNPLNAISPFTRKASIIENKNPNENYTWNFFYNLNPLPSSLIRLKNVGEDLSKVMGTFGSTGITTPTFAEIYYVFGLFGTILMIPLGYIYGFFEKLLFQDESEINTALTFIIIFLLISSIGIGLHSTTRAMTRPILYAYVLYLISRYIKI